MRIKYIKARPGAGGGVDIMVSVSGDRDSIFNEVQKVVDGFRRKPNGEYERPYDLILKPHYKSKSDEQLKAIWGKIGEIAEALETSKDEVYEICIKRYGQGCVARVDAQGLAEFRRTYRFIEIKEERDNTFFIRAWRGLRTYDSKEAKVLLDGILSECRDIGLSTEVCK